MPCCNPTARLSSATPQCTSRACQTQHPFADARVCLRRHDNPCCSGARRRAAALQLQEWKLHCLLRARRIRRPRAAAQSDLPQPRDAAPGLCSAVLRGAGPRVALRGADSPGRSLPSRAGEGARSHAPPPRMTEVRCAHTGTGEQARRIQWHSGAGAAHTVAQGSRRSAQWHRGAGAAHTVAQGSSNGAHCGPEEQPWQGHWAIGDRSVGDKAVGGGAVWRPGWWFELRVDPGKERICFKKLATGCCLESLRGAAVAQSARAVCSLLWSADGRAAWKCGLCGLRSCFRMSTCRDKARDLCMRLGQCCYFCRTK